MDKEDNHLERKQEEGECSNAQGVHDTTSSSTPNDEANPQTLPAQQPGASSPEANENGSLSFAAMLTQFDEFLANYGRPISEEDLEIEYDSEDSDLPELHLEDLEEPATHVLWRLDIDDMPHEELVDLEEQMGIIGTGLSEYTICEHLRRYIYYRPTISGEPQTDDAFCCICLEGIHNEELIGILDCGHEFHYFCVKEWLLRKNSCPLCRSTGVTPPN